jgi:hypothetical protein
MPAMLHVHLRMCRHTYHQAAQHMRWPSVEFVVALLSLFVFC